MSPKRRTSRPTPEEFQSTWWPRLEQHMWIDGFTFGYPYFGSNLQIKGLLKPQPNEGGGRVVRRMFMDVLDQVFDELGELGAVHTRHPDVHIRGEVLHSLNAPDDFSFLQCEVQFYLLADY